MRNTLLVQKRPLRNGVSRNMMASVRRRVLIAVSVLVVATAYAQTERWRAVHDMRWDTRTARRVNGTIHFWYLAPLLQEQREYLRGVDGNVVDQMTSGQYLVHLDCRQMRAGFASVTYMNEQETPVLPAVTVQQVALNPIAPDTNMEALAFDVCRRMR